jgi:hypothetical protein
MKGFPDDMEVKLGPDGLVLFKAKDRLSVCMRSLPTEARAS